MTKSLTPPEPGKMVFFNPWDGKEPYTTSEIVARETGTQHRKVRDAIRKYKKELETLGRVASYQAPLKTRGGTQNIISYRLNEQQATLIITLMKNTPVVVAFKVELVRQFFQMRRFISLLDTARLECPQLTDAIKAAHTEPKPYHYTNEFNMINRIALGMSTKDFRKLHGLGEKEDTRPYMDNDQIMAIVELQRADIGLLLAGLEYDERKARLQAYHDNRRLRLSA